MFRDEHNRKQPDCQPLNNTLVIISPKSYGKVLPSKSRATSLMLFDKCPTGCESLLSRLSSLQKFPGNTPNHFQILTSGVGTEADPVASPSLTSSFWTNMINPVQLSSKKMQKSLYSENFSAGINKNKEKYKTSINVFNFTSNLKMLRQL